MLQRLPSPYDLYSPSEAHIWVQFPQIHSIACYDQRPDSYGRQNGLYLQFPERENATSLLRHALDLPCFQPHACPDKRLLTQKSCYILLASEHTWLYNVNKSMCAKA